MHIHILGIGGTFMSAVAILARESGFTVSGCDAAIYPPVSDLLVEKNIEWVEGYEPNLLAMNADLIIVGNAIKRGMPILEMILNERKPYISGPQWLAETILNRYRVIAVAGTHGKTTTTSMIAHILTEAGVQPGFLVGGVLPSFKTNAHLGKGEWFVIEADEYDSAYFDKRPKLMHYRPEIAIVNNLEFDHADIYHSLAEIEQQFHYYLKTIPAKGTVIMPTNDQALQRVSQRGIYSNKEMFGFDLTSDWTAGLVEPDGSVFDVRYQQNKRATVKWNLIGDFNVENGLAAISSSYHAGVDPETAALALTTFVPPKRRLEVRGSYNTITVYDDFAHHPTAIKKTIRAIKNSKRHKRIIVVLEFASYTMRSGIHAGSLVDMFDDANAAYLLKPQAFELPFNEPECAEKIMCLSTIEDILHAVVDAAKPEDAILVMSNRGFANIHTKLLAELKRINHRLG